MYLLFSCKYVVYQYSDLWTPLSRCGTCRSGTCLFVCIGSWKRQVCLWSVPLLSVIPTFNACFCDCLLKERYNIAVMCKAQGVLRVISLKLALHWFLRLSFWSAADSRRSNLLHYWRCSFLVGFIRNECEVHCFFSNVVCEPTLNHCIYSVNVLDMWGREYLCLFGPLVYIIISCILYSSPWRGCELMQSLSHVLCIFTGMVVKN